MEQTFEVTLDYGNGPDEGEPSVEARDVKVWILKGIAADSIRLGLAVPAAIDVQDR